MGNEYVDLEITQYEDFFSHWFGLKDGTVTSLIDPRGKFWVRIGDEVVLAADYDG